MAQKSVLNKNVTWYVLKFASAFCVFYFGTLAIIGLSSPESYYSPFIDKYLNFIDWLRSSLLYTTIEVLQHFDYQPYLKNEYELFVRGGYGIRMVYSCIGYGVMSFWAAFVFANTGSWIRKFKWLMIGWIALWVINVFRLTALVIALNKKWEMPLGWDHHTWFNIFAYLLIFVLIYHYDKSSNTQRKKSEYPKSS